MASLQDLINKFEGEGGNRTLRWATLVLLMLGLISAYNWRSYRNLATQEAMDAAQVARNLSEGKGFSTLFIRPFSVYLIKDHNKDRLAAAEGKKRPDYAQLENMHPDLANPPLYPLVLASMMKVLPLNYAVNTEGAFWSIPHPRPTATTPRFFWRYQPDFFIALLNQVLLIAVAISTFFLARRLFDKPVAWLSFILVLCSEYLWQFSVSGLSTMLVLAIFMTLIWFLVWIESEERDPVWSHRAQTWLAIGVGLLLGLGMLTRYAFGWLLIPVLVYLGLACAIRRTQILVLVSATFLVVVSPWITRNVLVSGTPLGTAGYAIVEGSFLFPENRLQRSLQPDFKALGVTPFLIKLTSNSKRILQDELPKLGGTWMTALFLASLLLTFRNPALLRLRYLLLAIFLLFIIVQSLGRTQLSEDSPTLNQENLLVLLVPLVLVFGAGFFFQLLDQLNLKMPALRYIVIGGFGIVMCLPMIYIFLPPKTSPLVYPPYYPPAIQEVSKYMRSDELIMSDIPWAVAWYGNRQCIWLTSNADSDFFAVYDYLKQVRALYLTPQTTDSRVLSQWVRPGEKSWPLFVLEFMLRGQIVDSKFPLRFARAGFFPEQLFLADFERWRDAAPGPFAPASEDDPPKKTEATPKKP